MKISKLTKLIPVILILILALFFICSCGGDSDNSNVVDSENQAQNPRNEQAEAG